MKSERCRKYDVIAFIMILLLFFGIIVQDGDYKYNPDMSFLYNRAYNMLSCLKDGNVPWFFYNDFNGVGYGTPFFYGQLTLYPFLIFIDFGSETFLSAYILATIILTYLGACFFARRFCKNWQMVGLLFIFSEFSVVQFFINGTYANMFAFALSCFFFGYCVDFFRDRESFVKASVMFFLILNSHMVTAVLSFLVCVLLLLMYLDWNHLVEYIKFGVVTGLLCLYNLLNVMYHSEIVNRTDYINAGMFDSYYDPAFHDSVYMSYQDFFPVRGILLEIFFGHSEGYVYFELITFCILVVILVRSSWTWRKAAILGVVLVLALCSPFPCWEFLNRIWLNPIQFPMRYAPHMVLAFLVIVFRYSDRKVTWLLLLSLPTIFLRGPVAIKLDTFQPLAYFECVGNGEYLDESFVFDLNYFESFASDTRFTHDKEKTYFTASGESEVLFPKLWYRGYKAYTDEGRELQVSMGYSQYCLVHTDGYEGVIVLKYVHPWWLGVVGTLCYLSVLFLVSKILLESLKKNGLI